MFLCLWRTAMGRKSLPADPFPTHYTFGVFFKARVTLFLLRSTLRKRTWYPGLLALNLSDLKCSHLSPTVQLSMLCVVPDIMFNVLWWENKQYYYSRPIDFFNDLWFVFWPRMAIINAEHSTHQIIVSRETSQGHVHNSYLYNLFSVAVTYEHQRLYIQLYWAGRKWSDVSRGRIVFWNASCTMSIRQKGKAFGANFERYLAH